MLNLSAMAETLMWFLQCTNHHTGITDSIFNQDPVINSLFPGRCGCDFECVNFKHNLGIDVLSIQLNITL